MVNQNSWLENTLPETNSSHLKIGHPQRKLVFQPSIFRGYVSFREGKRFENACLNRDFYCCLSLLSFLDGKLRAKTFLSYHHWNTNQALILPAQWAYYQKNSLQHISLEPWPHSNISALGLDRTFSFSKALHFCFGGNPPVRVTFFCPTTRESAKQNWSTFIKLDSTVGFFTDLLNPPRKGWIC